MYALRQKSMRAVLHRLIRSQRHVTLQTSNPSSYHNALEEGAVSVYKWYNARFVSNSAIEPIASS